MTALTVDDIRTTLLPRLSEAEAMTLRLLGNGLEDQAIAGELGLSATMFKPVMRGMLSKMHFRSRDEAAEFSASQSEKHCEDRDDAYPAIP